MLVFFATLCVLALGISLIAVKILLKDGGEFSGTCSTNSPFGNPDGSCVCGRRPEEACPNAENPDHTEHCDDEH